MKVLVNCGKLRNGRDALIIEKGGCIEYVICRNYDPAQPIGQQWDHGTYIGNLYSFGRAIIDLTDPVSVGHMTEIATQAMSYLKDNYLLEDFLYDRAVDLEEEEREFFFPEEGDE